MQYRMMHQPFEDGDPLWNLTANGTFPAYVYDEPQDFLYGDWAKECLAAVLRVRGKPDELVRIWRAVPHGVDVINTGDWVYLHPGPANLHGWVSDEEPGLNWPLLTARVPAHTIRSGGNDLIEWGYFGPTIGDLSPSRSVSSF